MQAGLPFLIAATKSDKLNKTQRTQQLDAYCTLFEELPDTLLIPFSAVNGEGVEEIRRQIELVCMGSVQDSYKIDYFNCFSRKYVVCPFTFLLLCAKILSYYSSFINRNLHRFCENGSGLFSMGSLVRGIAINIIGK